MKIGVFAVAISLLMLAVYAITTFNVGLDVENIKAQEDALTYCHHYCEKKAATGFFYGSVTGCICQFSLGEH